MGTLSRYSQKTSISQAAKIKPVSHKGRDRIEGKLIHLAGFNDSVRLVCFLLSSVASKKGHYKAGKFHKGNNAQSHPKHREKASAGLFRLIGFLVSHTSKSLWFFNF
jgi:hypothetical protein